MESEGAIRLHFDATLDDLVDTNRRLMNRSQRYRAPRTGAVWVTGVCLPAAFLATVFYHSQRDGVPLTARTWTLLLIVAVALGAGFAFLRGWYVDWHTRHHTKRIYAELLGGNTDVPCDIELRRGGVWATQKGVEITFPWGSSTAIEDTGDAVELWFNSSLVIARNKAFQDRTQRSHFIEQARAFSNATTRPAATAPQA